MENTEDISDISFPVKILSQMTQAQQRSPRVTRLPGTENGIFFAELGQVLNMFKFSCSLVFALYGPKNTLHDGNVEDSQLAPTGMAQVGQNQSVNNLSSGC